jgi:hypothetical protein
MRSWCLALVAVVAVVACDRGVPPPTAPKPTASVAPPAPAAPARLSSGDVDTLLRAEWQKAGVAPTPRADDATWLRRAWIDVLGTIPPPEVARRFLADTSTDKRARAIDEMLASPLWADHWTAYWDEVWMGRDTRAPDVDRGAFRAWLHDVLAKDVRWDQVVTQLLTASGLNSAGGPKRAAYLGDGHGPVPEGVNGAVNWTLRYQLDPQDMAGNASRSLLGVQIQCAQCHDHKTEKWTQQDFRGFAAAFVRTRLVPLDRGKNMADIRRVEVHDLDHAAPRFAKMADNDAIEKAAPRALDGTALTGQDGGVRAALARWVTSPSNAWFARALVNRMWGHFLGRGFVDPVDDLRPSNPPAAPALLDALAADFVTGGYRVKDLVRTIVGSETYALSAAPLPEATAKADPEVKLWERFRVTPLGPEELLNALVAATRVDAVVRAMGRMDLDEIRAKVRQRYGFLFDVDEEADAGDYEGTIAQGLALLNGSIVAAGASVLPGSALAEVLGAPGDDESKLEAVYLRTLGRLPAPDEIERWTQFLAAAQSAADTPAPAPPPPPAAASPGPGKKRAPDPLARVEKRAAAGAPTARVRAWEDLLWALLNSSEFVLNH